MKVNEYLTTREVAQLLKVNVVTVQRWIQKGWLPAIRIGRKYWVKKEDIDKAKVKKRKK